MYGSMYGFKMFLGFLGFFSPWMRSPGFDDFRRNLVFVRFRLVDSRKFLVKRGGTKVESSPKTFQKVKQFFWGV